MEDKVLDGNQINSELDFHYQISKLLDFASGFGLSFDEFWNNFYGKNFNAFWDCFSDCFYCDPPFRIVFKSHLHAKEHMGDGFSILIDFFEDAKGKSSKFDYSLE